MTQTLRTTAWNRVAAGLAVAAVFVCAGCGRSEQSAAPPATASAGRGADSVNQATAPNPAEIPVPQPVTGVLRVYTEPPGLFVLVDGEPVRNAEGELQPAPCAVTLAQGSHTVTVARDGLRDASQVVTVSGDGEVVFERPEADESGGILAAPYFNVKVGEPVALRALNSPGSERDPFVTPDGLSIFFAAERSEGNGVYVATRPSPFHEFEPPRLLLASRSGDVPATPSVSGDGLTVYYGIAGKARLFALMRDDPLSEFTDKQIVQFSRDPSAVWPSVQVLGSGLRLYWAEDGAGGRRTLATNRGSLEDEFSEQLLQVPLPGVHPCLSADGLRQYVFDGKVLRRARRADVKARFSFLEVVANLSLPAFQPDERRRPYFVTDDEQWMFYSAPSENSSHGADLYLVRLSEGRGWGFAPRGAAIPPRPAVASRPDDAPSRRPMETPADTSEPAPKAAEKPVDPRSLPLPYTAHRAQFLKLLSERNYAEARAALEAAQTSPQLADQRELLEWDSGDLARIEAFWKDVDQAIGRLKPGAEVRYAGARVEFVRVDDGVFVAKSRSSTIEKPLRELSTGDLVALVDAVAAREDAAVQLRLGTFLLYDRAGNRRSAELRFHRGGDEGKALFGQTAERKLRQARMEFDRENVAAGMKFLEAVLSDFPNSAFADQARELEQRLYTLTRWNPVGRRQWSRGEEGEYTAEAAQTPDSYLLSPRQYENFELKLEWKTTGRTGQGGVYFRYPGRGRPYDRAFKLHLANDYGVAADLYCTGSLFAIEAPTSNAVLPEGRWNTLVLRVQGEKVQAVINGKPVLDTMARSSNIPQTGHVALDGVVGGISYRKILLTELVATE